MKSNSWKRINWDGNYNLKLECWRKSFSGGHVSIGIGDFQHIVYSYGPNSDRSLSGTRHRLDGNHQTEEDAKAMVDRNKGHYSTKDN